MEGSALMSVKDITNDPSFKCSPSEAYVIYKSHIVDNIKSVLSDIDVRDIADLGCGTGETTQLLALNYPDAYIAGIDLSPNYLSIGMTKFKESTIQWIHANIAEGVSHPSRQMPMPTSFEMLHQQRPHRDAACPGNNFCLPLPRINPEWPRELVANLA